MRFGGGLSAVLEGPPSAMVAPQNGGRWGRTGEGAGCFGGGGGWHKASVSDCVPLAAPIGLLPLLILTLCGPERVLVVSTEPPDDTSGVGGGRGKFARNMGAWCSSVPFSLPCALSLTARRPSSSLREGPAAGFPAPPPFVRSQSAAHHVAEAPPVPRCHCPLGGRPDPQESDHPALKPSAGDRRGSPAHGAAVAGGREGGASLPTRPLRPASSVWITSDRWQSGYCLRRTPPPPSLGGGSEANKNFVYLKPKISGLFDKFQFLPKENFSDVGREPIGGRPAVRGKRTYGGRPGQRVEEQGTWASQKHSEAGYGRPVDRGVWAAKTVKRLPQQPAQPPIRQLLGAADVQTAHPATTSTAPAHQRLGSANAETTPARAPAAAADRTQRPDATCEGKNG